MTAGPALVLFSGGQDSTVCLAWALERFERVETIGFAYGQRHEVELIQRPVVRRELAARFPAWAPRLGEDTVLDNNGRPIPVQLTLHGKIANLPAHFVAVEVDSQPPYEITVTGQVEESAIFCPGLELRTRISTRPGSNRLVIADNFVLDPAKVPALRLRDLCKRRVTLVNSGKNVPVIRGEPVQFDI